MPDKPDTQTATSTVRCRVKWLVNGAAGGLVLPLVLLWHIGAKCLGPDTVFPGWSQMLSLIPGLTGQYLRRAFYSRVLRRCGADSCVTFGTIFSHPTVAIGRNVYIGAYCSIGDVTIEDDVLIASRVSIMNGSAQHGTERIDVPIREQPGEFVPVTIGEGTWIGEQATVAADVGRHCVIGAGAVVTRPIPDYAIAVGVPARVLRLRTGEPPRDSGPSLVRQLDQTESLATAASAEC